MNRIISEQNIVEQRIFPDFVPNLCCLIKKMLLPELDEKSAVAS